MSGHVLVSLRLIIFYHIISCHINYNPLEAHMSSNERQKESRADAREGEEELGGEGEGKP